MWVDRRNRLCSGRFERGPNGYRVSSKLDDLNDPGFAGPEGQMVDAGQLSSISRYLSDREFPVRVDTLNNGDYRAMVCLVWQAQKRRFHNVDVTEPKSDPDIAWAAVRTVVMKKEQLISDTTFEVRFSQPSPRKVLVEDLTGDGIKEYAYYERHMTEYLQVWSLSSSGVFQPLKFLSSPGDKPLERLDGMKLCVESALKNQVIIRVFNPLPDVIAPHLQDRITQETYEWQVTSRSFMRTSKIEGRKTDFFKKYRKIDAESAWPGYTFSLNSCG